MKPKRGQISQIFVYIITLLVIGLVIMFGYKGIKTITSTAQTGDTLQFKNEINNMFASSSSYGSEDYPSFKMPGSAIGICFVDSAAGKGGGIEDDGMKISNLITDAIGSTEDNTYLIRADGGIDPFKIDTPLTAVGKNPNSKAVCISTPSGTLRVHLIGKGKTVGVEKYTPK